MFLLSVCVPCVCGSSWRPEGGVKFRDSGIARAVVSCPVWVLGTDEDFLREWVLPPALPMLQSQEMSIRANKHGSKHYRPQSKASHHSNRRSRNTESTSEGVLGNTRSHERIVKCSLWVIFISLLETVPKEADTSMFTASLSLANPFWIIKLVSTW